MDWTQALTIIGVFSAFFIYLISKMDNKFEHLGDRRGKVENRLTAMEVEIKNMNQRISTVENYLVPKKFYPIEDHHREEPKEN